MSRSPRAYNSHVCGPDKTPALLIIDDPLEEGGAPIHVTVCPHGSHPQAARIPLLQEAWKNFLIQETKAINGDWWKLAEKVEKLEATLKEVKEEHSRRNKICDANHEMELERLRSELEGERIVLEAVQETKTCLKECYEELKKELADAQERAQQTTTLLKDVWRQITEKEEKDE